MECDRLAGYLAGLAANNHREWFEARRPEYQALRDDFVAFTGEVIRRAAVWDEGLAWVDPVACVFRIYRDTRFSRDKTPYKTHFGASINEGGRKGEGPGYYFHVDHEGMLLAAGGVYTPTPEQLARIRAFIAEHPEKLEAVLKRRGFKKTFGELQGDRLKRPPRGYAEDAPLIEQIKLKTFHVWCERDARALTHAQALDYVVDSFQAMLPLVTWLREALEHAEEPAPTTAVR